VIHAPHKEEKKSNSTTIIIIIIVVVLLLLCCGAWMCFAKKNEGEPGEDLESKDDDESSFDEEGEKLIVGP